eukprot:UN02886
MSGEAPKDSKLLSESVWFTLTLRSEDEAPVFCPPPGSFLTLRVIDEELKIDTLRHYSIYNKCQPGGNIYKIAVNVVPGGVVSNYLLDNCEIGSVLDVNPPVGTFLLKEELYTKYLNKVDDFFTENNLPIPTFGDLDDWKLDQVSNAGGSSNATVALSREGSKTSITAGGNNGNTLSNEPTTINGGDGNGTGNIHNSSSDINESTMMMRVGTNNTSNDDNNVMNSLNNVPTPRAASGRNFLTTHNQAPRRGSADPFATGLGGSRIPLTPTPRRVKKMLSGQLKIQFSHHNKSLNKKV